MKSYLKNPKTMTHVEKKMFRIRNQALTLQVTTLLIISSVGFIVPSNTKNKEWKKPKYNYTKMRSTSTADSAVKYFSLPSSVCIS